MEAFAIALEGLALAEWLRFSRWGYATVNTTHVLGLGLLIGAIVTLDLRLIGLWKATPIEQLYRVLSPVAASGLGIAIITGMLLFSVRATEYVELELFFVKLGLVVAGTGFVAVIHFRYALERLSFKQQRLVGIMSLSIWLSVLVSGRLLAFV
ncbi:MAG: hypothetical protein QNJ69_13825 [Gammaproteobacteria bacterium]|nr:hypothetical protein [Gammaproteobacteria bacterium]